MRSGVVVALALGLLMQPGLSSAPRTDDGGTPVAGTLSVTTDPAGATVFVDGRDVGPTPLQSVSVSAGEHRVRVVKNGYLENARVVNVAAGQPSTVKVTLTRTAARTEDPSEMQVTGGGGGGSNKKWLWIGLAGGGAAVAAIALANRNSPPNAGNSSVSPAGTGMAGQTTFTFSSTASDPNGDSLSYTWNFGDGSSGTGPSPTHVYATAGSYSVGVKISDGKTSVDGPAVSVVVGPALTGTWASTGKENTFGCNVNTTFSQNGQTMTGTMPYAGNCSGTITLASASVGGLVHPASVTWQTVAYTFTTTGDPCSTGCSNLVSKFSGTTDAAGTTLTGTYTLTQGTTFTQTTSMTFRKQ